MKKQIYNKEYWLELQQRYFEALTTDEEEQRLKLFVSSTDDSDFRELKAVMGYAATKKAIQPKITYQNKSMRYAVAAAITIIIGVSAVMLFSRKQDCVAYVGGEKVTDKAKIELLMAQTMQNMKTTDIAEAQLADVLNTNE